jgi:hypothetical protein
MRKYRFPDLEVSSRRGTEYIYYRVGKGLRVRLPGPVGSQQFHEAYALARDNRAGEIPKIAPPSSRPQSEERVEARLLVSLKTCRIRAQRRGLAFDLDAHWLQEKLLEQDFKCLLTGIRFMSKFEGRTKVHPFTPSIDRIVPALGYTRENSRIVIFAINAMMMDWGEELFAQVCKSYRSNGTKNRDLRPRSKVISPRKILKHEKSTV